MMTPPPKGLPGAVARFKTALVGLFGGVGRLFHSKQENVDRTAGVIGARKLQAMEAERLDRLRNPGNYRGK
jgi:hypothetical protein